jgi:ubiquinone biosynthesis protein
MVGKALMTVEGIGKQLDPDLDVWTELRPYFTKLLMNRYSPQRIGRDLLRGVRQLGSSASSLPGQVHDILEDLRAGRLSLTTRDEEQARATDRLGRRLFAAILAAALLGGGVALLAVGRERAHEDLGLVMLIVAFLTVISHLWRDRRR